MDGPELVPCEKLEPIPDLGGGPLPRPCAYFAMVYYFLVIIASCVAIYMMPSYVSEFVDDEIWVETALFSAFWSLLVVEILFIGLCSFVSTLKDVIQNKSLVGSLHHLFPTVDAAIVDDFVYKSETGEQSAHPSQEHSKRKFPGEANSKRLNTFKIRPIGVRTLCVH